ncbi:DUF72 domain-containing protein [Sediminibacterium ginsengisoli]|uniref:Uncharacterized conserved protein YecE, DUF72 family n=1 Tax=Sediminibacterium ginsengisoli TaxID=413434 RepID=A0A1T4RR52_9BACT|nr:DUF72 domain-containing protein [Sediminibacterium ginsengisoli]SKA18444.1 Uncharacterized conserved protein YecE, DUF72 family [Sediminibacterium ginsengisoli]
MRKGKIHIGTSGWSYRHWKGKFYPAGLAAAAEFSYYCSIFKTVELNNSFYRIPDKETFINWRKKTPGDFLFAVKGGRYFTHLKKLKADRPALKDFFERAMHLGKKLGPVLFQLPPRWKCNVERLAGFLELLPEKIRCCFEFRDTSWYNEEVYKLLRSHNCAFCIYELAGHISPLTVTAGFVYVRLHGPGAKYQGSYPAETLQEWASRCLSWQRAGKDVYVYFDNDQEGYAAFNAVTFLQLVQ